MKPCFYRPPQVNEQLTCKAKVKYATKTDADKVHSGQRAYRCPYCKCWHLTMKRK